jgi:hypothetical protein
MTQRQLSAGVGRNQCRPFQEEPGATSNHSRERSCGLGRHGQLCEGSLAPRPALKGS